MNGGASDQARCKNCNGARFLVDGSGRKFPCHVCDSKAVWDCTACNNTRLRKGVDGKTYGCPACPPSYAYAGFVHVETSECPCEACDLQRLLDAGFIGVP